MVWAPSRAEKNLNRPQYVGVGVARTAKEKGQGSRRKMDTGLFLRSERSGWSQNRKLKPGTEWSMHRMDSQAGRVRGGEVGDSSERETRLRREGAERGYLEGVGFCKSREG